MAVQRILGTTLLLAVDSTDAIAGIDRMLGYDFATSATDKVVVAGYVKMNAAGTFVTGTKWQLWKRATPISSSTRLQNIEIGDGIVSGASGSEQAVPGVANTALVQNDRYFVTIFHPDTQTGNYWFDSTGDPISLDAHNIFKNDGTADNPPDDETFTGGRFAVDIAIDDASSAITATLAITLPVPALALTADSDISASLGITLPIPAPAFTADADINSSLAITLPVPVASLTADADIAASLNLTLPVPQASFELSAIAQAVLSILLPIPSVSLTIAEEVQAANLREYIWGVLKADPTLNSLGIDGQSLFGTNAPDSPAATLQKWMVIRWGNEEPPLGRDTDSRRRFLSVWAYDRRRDFSDIDLMLHRARTILYPLKAIDYNSSAGYITEVTDNGFSEDFWDEAYSASARNWSLTIIASGV